MHNDVVVVSKPEFQFSSPGSFPRMEEYEFDF